MREEIPNYAPILWQLQSIKLVSLQYENMILKLKSYI